MDYLRSAYSTNIWIHNGTTNLFEKIPITWFKAPTNAIPLGVNHQYGSANWQRGTPFPEKVGEVLGDPRTYSKGSPVNGYFGLNHCGSDNLWTGQLNKLTTAMGNRPSGAPTCCSLGGNPCSFCSSGRMPLNATLILQGGTGDFAQFNNFWQLVNQGGCTCSVRAGNVTAEWFANGQGLFVAAFNSVTGAFVQFSRGDSNCQLGGTNWVFNSSQGVGTHQTVINLVLP